MRGLTELPTQIFLNTDLGSLIGIFLQLHFYVKSILTDFRRSKSAILTILEALNFDFWKNFTLENVLRSKNQKFRAALMVKMSVFGASNDQD